MKKFIIPFLIFALFLSSFPFSSLATDSETVARDITKEAKKSVTGYSSTAHLYDGNRRTTKKSDGNVTVKLEHAEGIGSLYIILGRAYGEYTVTDNTSGKVYTAGTYSMLHDFLDLEAAFGAAPTSVTVKFENGIVSLNEITAFTVGQTPDYVQKWKPPLEGGADILMMPTHGDDDQLYFAGLLPLYAGELGYRVQVVYMTDHHNNSRVRVHEMLNGLWAVGVDVYPVFGDFIDFRNDSLEETYQVYGYYDVTRDDILSFVTEQVRRFKPMVIVGHDINGEYGHGMHKAYCDTLMEAVSISMDPEKFPESAQRWGTWDVPKTYLHLLEDNPIVLDYDTPLESFDGLTAFQVSQKLGFPCHLTQQDTIFPVWLYGKSGKITKATQIAQYNPCNFGLFRTTVGPDVEKNDFLENIVCYAEQERLEAERLEQERLEQERLEQERLEQERLEQERLEQERLEQERLEKERMEQERLEKERLEQERLQAEQVEAERQENLRRFRAACIILIALVLFLIMILSALTHRRRASKEKRKKSLKN